MTVDEETLGRPRKAVDYLADLEKEGRFGPGRMVANPEVEVTLRGPREAFVESLEVNVSLLCRRLDHPDLLIETCRIGRRSRTTVALLYLKGLANEKVLEELRVRLNRLEIDGVTGSGHIEQLIGDAPSSPFSTMSYSERPDVVAARLLEGRVGILIDGTPEVLTVPALFIESFQTPDDYNTNPFAATLLRWIKYLGFIISILGPAVYIALSSYHHELIPTPLFIKMVAGAEGTPFPVLVEVIGIGALFEIFREAGIRLPRPIGQGVTFVAALVLAQAAVSLGITGIATVVVVTITALATLIIPNQAHFSLVIRFILAVLASFLGAYGILLGLLFFLAHAVSLRSFGTPYLAPLAPFNPGEFWREVFLRAPLWCMRTRPRTIGWQNLHRQQGMTGPIPPPEGGEEQLPGGLLAGDKGGYQEDKSQGLD